MSGPSDDPRHAPGAVNSQGQSTFTWSLTDQLLNDRVKLVLPPNAVLPVIFVPGIMGSNLRGAKKKEKIWRLDTTAGQPLGLAKKMVFSDPGDRQRLLHPDRTEVDPEGSVPKEAKGSVSNKDQYRTERFWGEVAEGSYHEFLLWLEHRLNGQGYNPGRWTDFSYTSVSATPRRGDIQMEPILFPGIIMNMRGFSGINSVDSRGPSPTSSLTVMPVMSDDLISRAKFRMPVYACGYNWLASNTQGARRLKERIEHVISANNRNGFKCEQVLLVTHSMGGLVARRCALLPGMEEKIAGIVHGVMPAIGAAVAYRRCKVGMRDEDFKAGLVIGSDGQEVTAVFAQAPGALQLLPSEEYQPGWLKITSPDGKVIESQPAKDPYDSIYLRRDRWWGLVREEWLRPKGGIPLTWRDFAANVNMARKFHEEIRGTYHPTTYVYYGADSKYASFESVEWKIKDPYSRTATDNGYVFYKPKPPSDRATPERVRDMNFDEVADDGSNPLSIRGPKPAYQPYSVMQAPAPTHWILDCAMQDGGGDGTVPRSSGCAPLFLATNPANVKQQFRLSGFAHEPSYRNGQAQLATLYSIQKIASVAKKLT